MKRYRITVFALFGLLLLFALVKLLDYFAIGISYQGTASMPEGYYLTYPVGAIRRGDVVLFQPDSKLQRYILKRGWLQKPIPLLKEVVGIPGDWLCIEDKVVYINKHKIAIIKTRDNKNRPLAHFHFCGRIPPSNYFLEGISDPDSFDSRYYGLIDKTQILSKAVRL
ncbi:MAG: signal peptidase I [Francisellaceae bacterium]